MKSISAIFGIFVAQFVLCNAEYNPGYYLHFPPIPYNHINFNGPPPQFPPPWLQQNQNNQINQNQTNSGGPGPTVRTMQIFPNPPIPGSNPQQLPFVNPSSKTLHNGTLLYYVSGPWGGIKSIPVDQNIDNSITTTPPNWSAIPSILQPPEFAYFNRQQQNQQPPQTSSPNPNDQWNQNQANFGWGGWGPYYENPSVTTQNPPSSTSPGARNQPSTSTTTEGNKMTSTSTTTEGTTVPTNGTTTTPSSADTLTRFRQLVTRIREVTRQQLKS